MESIDEHFIRVISAEASADSGCAPAVHQDTRRRTRLLELFEAQVLSRHLDFAARWLHAQGGGFCTIASAGHESNAALGLLAHLGDPALLHYRSGGFYTARAGLKPTSNPVRDLLLSLTSASADPISGGRHKAFGHPELNIIPQTSTIGSHLPRAVGLAFAIDLARKARIATAWPPDAVVLCSFGDASANHSTATGAFNAASYLTHRRIECPVLFVCEDNGIGISTRSPQGWPAVMLSRIPGISYWAADGDRPLDLLDLTEEALGQVRSTRRPGLLHLRTVRFMGHAGSDAEMAYRSRAEIRADYERDPLLATAKALATAGHLSATEVLDRYEATRTRVMAEARHAMEEERLLSREDVMAPLRISTLADSGAGSPDSDAARRKVWGARLPEQGPAMNLAQAINAALTDIMTISSSALVFGEDVAAKGGVYGVTRGLRKRFGGLRVFDTLLDEQTILGVALGAALAGFVPIPEIQYLAYLHNAEDQLRGEAATLGFFSNSQYRNGMVIRIAGLAYQRGFGGHFHNDNSIAVLRDIPGLVLAVPSHPADAPAMLRTCFELARQDGRVCVFLEPIARYHTTDLIADGDGRWTAHYLPPGAPVDSLMFGEVMRYGQGRDLLIVTFGNGVHMSLRASARVAREGIETSVVDLRWLAPLPLPQVWEIAQHFGAVLVVDETRHSGGVSEAVVSELIDAGYTGRLRRVTSADSFIPLGPAAETVLLGEDEIVEAIRLLATQSTHSSGAER